MTKNTNQQKNTSTKINGRTVALFNILIVLGIMVLICVIALVILMKDWDGEGFDAVTKEISEMEQPNEANIAEGGKLIFFIGNSVTYHGKKEGVWYGEWGMAASSKDTDYVAVTTRLLSEKLGVPVTNERVNMADWELDDKGDRTGYLARLDKYLKNNPDYVVIELGENTPSKDHFKEDYIAMVKYIRKKCPDAIIANLGQCINFNSVDALKEEIAGEVDLRFVKTSDICEKDGYKAGTGVTYMGVDNIEHEIDNEDVGKHPGDKGMQVIGERLVKALTE